MIDQRKALGNMPEKGNKYDEARHQGMRLKKLFQYDFISLPRFPKNDLACACGKPNVVLIDGVPFCGDCLSARNKNS